MRMRKPRRPEKNVQEKKIAHKTYGRWREGEKETDGGRVHCTARRVKDPQ